MKRHPVYITAGPVMLLIAALFLLTGAVQSGPSGSDAPVTRQDIALAPGWNLISSHLTPSNPDLAAIFATTADKVVLVKDGEGNIYSPEYGINTIGNWDTRESYMVFVTAPTVLQIEGTPAPADQPITLKPGWNLLSYLLSTPSPVKEAFKSLGDALVILKDNSGRTYLPEYDIDTIGELVPGQGYSAFVSRPADLVYAEQSADHPVFKYNPECLAQPNHVLVEDFGTLTPGIAADSTQRAANTSAINAAIAAAPSPGVVCLPADSLYLTLDHIPTSYTSTGIIRLSRDQITLWGAGACDWGDLPGCTYLATPGDEFYYRGSVNDDGKDHLVRGHGIVVTARPAPNDSLRNITLKGFELDGQSGWTGCYSYNYDWLYSVHFNCWDMGHKGVIIGSDRNVTDVLIEDVKVHHYKGEVIYQGGFGTGTVTVRRVWSFESNGSAHNFATAKNMLIEDSKFGPFVRFWGEYLAEGIDEAKALFRRNEYVGCEYSSGCIAIAVQSPGTSISQDWTWENNTFQLKGPNYHAFYISPGRPYTLRLLNNTFDGGRLFITGGNQTALTTLDIQGNTITSTGNKLWIWQGGRWGGVIKNNEFTGSGQLYEGPCNCDQVVVEDNTFIGLKPPISVQDQSAAPGHNIAALFRNNIYTAGPPTAQLFGETYKRVNPFSETLLLITNFQAYVVELGPESANGQVTQITNTKSPNSKPFEIILPSNYTSHSWNKDIIIKPNESLTVRFDRDKMQWQIVEM